MSGINFWSCVCNGAPNPCAERTQDQTACPDGWNPGGSTPPAVTNEVAQQTYVNGALTYVETPGTPPAPTPARTFEVCS